MIAAATRIRDLRPEDWPEVAAIYEAGVRTGHATFDTAAPTCHLRCGFRIVGVRERLGRLGGVWRDVLLRERRSADVS